MAYNSFQSDDDLEVDVFSRYINEITAGISRDDLYKMGLDLPDYIEETKHGSWEGWSDTEIVAINQFLRDLWTFTKQKEGY